MSLKSKIRDWIFPSKDDSFDDSYDYLLDFFNTLDEEFGGVIDFLFDRKITKFFRTEVEIQNTSAGEGELGLYIKSGDIYRYENSTWVIIDKVGRLPKIRQRDPNTTDLGYDNSETWINSMSGHSFRLIGDIVIDEVTGEQEALWCDQNGQVNSSSKSVHKFYFFPSVNFRYKTKTLHQIPGGGFTYEDSLMHLDGSFNEDGIGQYLDHDTHMDIFIQDELLGTLLLKRTGAQTLMDLDIFAPEGGGLPPHDDSAIYPGYKKFERLLCMLEISSITNDRLSKTLKGDMVFNTSIFDIINNPLAFNRFFHDNAHLMISEPVVIEIKERYRSFFASLHDQEMTMDQKEFAIYLLGVCVAWQAYDGNIYYINGNTMLADGNVLPTC